ncbi:MAG: hypothetical protein ORO03_10260, partial [Alphaproteobacteria bacterium]|nr:hypothetical protein [Alphaproteobacteria bacterium]
MSIVNVPQKQTLPIDQDDLLDYLKESQNLDEIDITRSIIVIGLGGAGCNAIRNLEKVTLDSCVRLLAVNTDLEDLRKVQKEHRFLIGAKTTRGQGAGSKPERGQRAMEEQLEQLLERIGKVDMAIIVAGMGGGTGTGSAAVLIESLRNKGVLVLAQITMPHKSDGFVRMERAKQGKAKVEAVASATITILNDNLTSVMGENTRFRDALRYADSVLIDGLTNILDVIFTVGEDNLDFADIENAFSGGGKTLMSVASGVGEDREIKAVEA